jgi:acetylornithine/succinyldiaminopimelate/putrescine aminotransferase
MVMSVPPLLPTYPPFPFLLEAGRNDRVWDAEGNAYWDFYGGHCVCLTGHCHPKIVEAITTQAEKLVFYSTAGELEVRTRAARELVRFAGSPFASVFFCNSGAEANENALKVAAKLTGRKRFLAFRGGWHGRTALALAVTDDPPIRSPYEGLLAGAEWLPFNDLSALESLDLSRFAAVILEPVQSMAGIVSAEREWLEALRQRCRESGVLLVFDEIQTGFGRLGSPFAKDVYGVLPDMASCAKGIASGVPMGALLMSEEVASKLGSGDLGSTFGGGPIACAAMLATLEVILNEGLPARALDCESAIRAGLAGTVVREVRGKGLLLGLDCGRHAKELKSHLLEKRILCGGSHDARVLRLMPPLTLTDEAIAALVDAVRTFPGGGD